MAATHNNDFYVRFYANVTGAQVREWLEKHPPPYPADMDSIETRTESGPYDELQHETDVWFWVPDEELSVVVKAQIDAWCEARMGIDCGYNVEMF